MTGKDLQKAMSDISDDFILEASPDQAGAKTVPIWRRSSFRVISGLAAACLVLVIGFNTYQVRHANSEKAVEPVMDMNSAAGESAEKAAEDTPLNAYEAPLGAQSNMNEAPAAAGQSAQGVEMEPVFEAYEADMEDGAVPEATLLPVTEMVTEALSEAISESESESESESGKKHF